ncbi:MAG: hypothetical protein JWM28_3715, partial [Chitinophagaceae bacterium]|nr:hypothetical protein [Chitinophagaceae bacterium]
MKQLIICLLSGTIWSVVTFSQTDTAQALTSSI